MIIKYNDFLNEKLTDNLSGFNKFDIEQKILNGEYNLVKYYNQVKSDNYPKLSDEFLIEYLSKQEPNEMLNISIQINFLDGVKLAIKNGAVIDDNIFNCIVFNGSIEIIKYLDNHNIIDVHDKHDYILMQASEKGTFDVIKYVLSDGKKINDEIKRDFIFWNVFKNHYNIVKYLVEHGFEIYEKLFETALAYNYSKILFYLIDNYKNDFFYERFKYNVVKNNNYKVVEYLLKHKIVKVDKYMYEDARTEKMKKLLKEYDKEV